MTALDNKDTFFGLRMRKRRTRLAIIFSVFIILAYFDPLKREVDLSLIHISEPTRPMNI